MSLANLVVFLGAVVMGFVVTIAVLTAAVVALLVGIV